MTWLHLLAQAGIIASIIGIAIAIAAYFNGKHIKRGISEIVGKLDEGFSRMGEGFRRMDEWLKRMDERAEQRHMEVLRALEHQHQEHQDIIELLRK